MNRNRISNKAELVTFAAAPGPSPTKRRHAIEKPAAIEKKPSLLARKAVDKPTNVTSDLTFTPARRVEFSSPLAVLGLAPSSKITGGVDTNAHPLKVARAPDSAPPRPAAAPRPPLPPSAPSPTRTAPRPPTRAKTLPHPVVSLDPAPPSSQTTGGRPPLLGAGASGATGPLLERAPPGDVNGDGALDLVVGNNNGANQLFLGDGGGSLTEVAPPKRASLAVINDPAGMPPDVAEGIEAIEAEEEAVRKELPDYVLKIISGYEMRTYGFEIFECFRKLALVGAPVFFSPQGSASQLIFGLLVCFLTFGGYMLYAPYVDAKDDRLAQICQVQLFFALLSSVALRFDQDTLSQNRGSNFEALLVVVTVLPAALAIFFDTVVPWLGRKKRQQLRGRISEGVDKAKEVSAKAKEVSARVREISGKALLRRSAADSESESHKDAAPVAEPGHPSRASRVSHASIKVLNQRCRQTSHVYETKVKRALGRDEKRAEALVETTKEASREVLKRVGEAEVGLRRAVKPKAVAELDRKECAALGKLHKQLGTLLELRNKRLGLAYEQAGTGPGWDRYKKLTGALGDYRNPNWLDEE